MNAALGRPLIYVTVWDNCRASPTPMNKAYVTGKTGKGGGARMIAYPQACNIAPSTTVLPIPILSSRRLFNRPARRKPQNEPMKRVETSV
jgi:hypothetical protein